MTWNFSSWGRLRMILSTASRTPGHLAAWGGRLLEWCDAGFGGRGPVGQVGGFGRGGRGVRRLFEEEPFQVADAAERVGLLAGEHLLGLRFLGEALGGVGGLGTGVGELFG